MSIKSALDLFVDNIHKKQTDIINQVNNAHELVNNIDSEGITEPHYNILPVIHGSEESILSANDEILKSLNALEQRLSDIS